MNNTSNKALHQPPLVRRLVSAERVNQNE